MLLLIYPILAAQRSKRNMEWKLPWSFFFSPLTQLLICSSPSFALCLPLYAFPARLDCKKNTATHRFFFPQSSTKQRSKRGCFNTCGLSALRLPCDDPNRNKREKRNQSVKGPRSLTSCFSRTAYVGLLFRLTALAQTTSASCMHPHKLHQISKQVIADHYFCLRGSHGKKKTGKVCGSRGRDLK